MLEEIADITKHFVFGPNVDWKATHDFNKSQLE